MENLWDGLHFLKTVLTLLWYFATGVIRHMSVGSFARSRIQLIQQFHLSSAYYQLKGFKSKKMQSNSRRLCVSLWFPLQILACGMILTNIEYILRKKKNHKIRHAKKLDPGILDPKGTKQIEEHYRWFPAQISKDTLESHL